MHAERSREADQRLQGLYNLHSQGALPADEHDLWLGVNRRSGVNRPRLALRTSRNLTGLGPGGLGPEECVYWANRAYSIGLLVRHMCVVYRPAIWALNHVLGVTRPTSVSGPPP